MTGYLPHTLPHHAYATSPPSHATPADPTTHTSSPIVTGSSVVALKYSRGIVIAADNLASYGSLARFTQTKRLRSFNRNVVLGFGGDVSDMQHIDRSLNALSIRENYSHHHDSPPETELNARNLHTYLQKMMYKRRSDFNPLWNVIMIAGLDGKEKPYLASVDLLGTTFTAPSLATGFGSHLAQPILRKHVPDEAAAERLSKEQAVDLVKECMKVLFYRDARSLDNYSLAVVEQGADVEMREDEKLENQSWAFAETIRGYGTQVN